MDPAAFSAEFFEKCAAVVGANLELTLATGDCALEETGEVPEDACGVLPIVVELDGQHVATLELISPLSALAVVARRTLGNENPDKEADLSEEDLGAVAEVLTLMGGVAQEALRAQVEKIAATPAGWWRTDEPGDAALEPGDGTQRASGSFEIPDGPSVPLFLRIPATLLAATHVEPDRIVLLGLAEDQRTAFEPALCEARMQAVVADAFDEEAEAALADASVILISEGIDDALGVVRRIRLGNGTWSTPAVLCAAEPTEQSVHCALAAGFSHVLKLPAEPADLIRVLAAATTRETRVKRKPKA